MTMTVREAISKATVKQAEDDVTARLVEFFRMCAAKAGEPKPYVADDACRIIAEGCVRITLGCLEAGLDVARTADDHNSSDP